jgi:hypothetical protein
MPFTMPNYPTISWEGANPFATGVKQGIGTAKDYMDFLSKELENQKNRKLLPYAEQDIQSQIGLRGAQKAQHQAEAEKQQYLNRLLPQTTQADLAKAKAISQILSSVANPQHGQPAMNGASITQPNPGMQQSSPMAQNQPISQSSQNQPTPQINPEANNNAQGMPPINNPSLNMNNSGDYAKAALAMSLMGMGQPKIENINGILTAITPFGNYPVGQGMTPQQEALAKGIGKFSAEFYGDNVKAYQSYQDQGTALDKLTYEVENNPEFKNVTGPVGSFLTKWAGTPEQKELLGTLQSSSGEISLSVAHNLKGAWTGRDQAMVNDIKANPKTDFPETFIGKLKAQKLIGEVLGHRSLLQAQYVEQGISPIKAAEMAAKETPLSKFQHIINDIKKQEKLLKEQQGNNGKEYTLDEKLEWTAKKYGKTVEEVKKDLGIK